MSFGVNLTTYQAALYRNGYTTVGRSVNLYDKRTETPELNTATFVFLANDGGFTAYNYQHQEIGRGNEPWELEALLDTSSSQS